MTKPQSKSGHMAASISEMQTFVNPIQPRTVHLGHNLWRSAVPIGQAPKVDSWQDLPFDTSLVNGRNVPDIVVLGVLRGNR